MAYPFNPVMGTYPIKLPTFMIFTIDIKLNVIYNSMLVYNCNFDQIKNVVQAD